MTASHTTTKRPAIIRFFIKLVQIILYVPIQIVFIPFAIVGLVMALYSELWKSKQLGVSFSAVKALQYRWMMHFFNTRHDPLSVKFVKHFPCESHFGMWSILGALIISSRLFGFPEKLGKLVAPGEETGDTTAGIRVLTFDGIMQKHLDDVDQIVQLGSGFDLMVHHFTKGADVRVFEIDQVNSLNMKVETLRKADIDCDWITYIPVDFAIERWDEKLLGAGFSQARKTLFVWQSVSLYLEPDAVRKTLSRMGELCVPGSIIAQDFYSQTMVDGEYSKAAKKFKDVIEKMGEPWKFGIEMTNEPKAAVESYLRECGLRMIEYTQFGEKLNLEAYYCVVEAEKLELEKSP